MDEIPPQVPGYRLTRLLGRGSTATVWRARRESDDELVAVKIVRGGLDDESVREYAMLQHAAGEHVVGLHETLEVETDEGGSTALVLELLAGGSLERVVAERGHLTPGETVTIIAPIAEALAGLHDLGIVHGDLSPGNILLDSTGRPALADLGYSRLTGEAPGDVHGTDGFVAPEVLEGGDPGRASDVHAVGAIAWLCLAGSAPGHIAARPELGDLVPDEPALVEAVESCLATDPALRPEADEVARAVFDAVPAQPLRMTSPGDVASGLTRRIREAAAEDELRTPAWQLELAAARPAQPRRRWWQRRPLQAEGERVRREPRRGGRHAAPRRRDEPVDLSRDPDEVSEPRAIARSAVDTPLLGRRVGTVVVLAVALLLAVIVPWRQIATAEDEGGATPSPPSARTSSAPGPATSLATDRSAPRQAARGLAQELTTLRQQLVLDLDREVVARLDEPGSPAAARDGRLVTSLRESGHRYRGVELTVRSAQLQRTAGSTAVLRTVVDESAYTVVGPDGGRRTRPARPGQRVDLVLVWHDGAWRVRDVRAVPDVASSPRRPDAPEPAFP